MRPEDDQELIGIVKATGEIYSRQVSPVAARMFLEDLSGFSSAQIKAALSKCRLELKSFPTVADIVARIDDGRPGVEQAWAMLPKDDRDSVVWTDEMAAAFNVVRGMIDSDPIAARMAFKETYSRLLADARASRRPPNWNASLGHDYHGREAALREAVQRRRITIEHAQTIDSMFELDPPKRGALGFDVKGLLPEMPSD